MASNSLASILEKMKQGSITENWGAVCAFDRERLNRILQQQWLEKYDGLNYVPVFSGKMDLNNAKTEYGELTDILLGKPLLSFEPAERNSSKARLTLSILSGAFTAYQGSGEPMYNYNITEAQGYSLTLELDLKMVVGEVDQYGRVTLNISQGTKFSCNLAAPDISQTKLGEFFNQQFKALPPDLQVYELGMLNLTGVSDLHPERFVLMTQRAPSAEEPGALNAGDGAVVVLIKLKGSTSGDYPSPEIFPYLIPDDEENGIKKYSATMVLAKQFAGRCEHEKFELIQSLLFPGEKNVFVEPANSRFVPHDLVIFGNVDPSKTALTIEPGMHNLKAGSPKFRYSAYVNGDSVRADWTFKSLNATSNAGEMDRYTGDYTPATAADISQEVVRLVVTAEYSDPITLVKYRASALLLVTAEAMSLTPKLIPRAAGGEPVTFIATSLKGSNLTWSEPLHGTLEVNGNVATYTPPTTLDPKVPFVAQQILVTDEDGESVKGTVMLSAFTPTLRIDPPFVSTLARSGVVKLSEGSGRPPEFERSWSVLTEDGEVTSDGTFTAPSNPSTPFSVVQCDVTISGVLVHTGYSVIKNRNHVMEQGWTDLNEFRVTSLTKKNNLYANGYQQIVLEIAIKTNGDPATWDELNTLSMYYTKDNSNQQVAILPTGQTGLPEGNVLWAQTRIPNKYTPVGISSVAALTEIAPAGDVQHVYVYLMARDTNVVEKFHAVFHANNTSYASKDYEHEDKSITLFPEVSPTIKPEHYELKRHRRTGGGGDDIGDGNDDYNFDYFLDTLDYWTLTYTNFRGEVLSFRTATPINQGSNVRWESDFFNETMFSCTGWAFKKPDLNSPAPVLTYSPLLICDSALNPYLDTTVKDFDLPGGDLLFSVVRRRDIRQERFEHFNELKTQGMRFVMTDQQGHRHAIEVVLKNGDRNRLEVRTIAGTPS